MQEPEPISADSVANAPDAAEIRALLESSDIVPQALVLVHFTGDESVLDAIAGHIHGPWDHVQSIPQDIRDGIRNRLAPLLADHLQGKAARPPIPDRALLLRMMDVSVGQYVPGEYLPMMSELLGLRPEGEATGDEPVRFTPRTPLGVVVIGAGISGLCIGVSLKRRGIPFVIIEKNDSVGGTWYENSYPGCGVDTPNHFYSYTFAPNLDWTHYFSKRDENLSYLRSVAERFGLLPHIRFTTTVDSLTFVEARRWWRIETRDAAGRAETLEADIAVSAVGHLNRPSIPPIEGLDSFAGPVFHTARWDHSVPLEGKRVALVGTGASAIQVAPAIADKVSALTIFQRTPPWISTNPNYHRSVAAGKVWALRNIPYYANWYRFQLAWGSSDGVHPTLRRDSAWTDPLRSMNEANHRTREMLIDHIRSEVGGDEALLAKVIPDYPPYGKRMLRDSHWYATLTKPNVELVARGVSRVLPGGVEDSAGAVHDADVLVLATGFKASDMLGHVQVTGREGKTLREVWGDDDPKAYLGMTVPGFPNLFVMFGPNTNFAHGGSWVYAAEGQAKYIVQCIAALAERGAATLECRPEVLEAYVDSVDAAHAEMVWGQGNVKTWYKNSKGRVFSLSPFRLVDHWHWMNSLNEDDYVWTARAEPAREAPPRAAAG